MGKMNQCLKRVFIAFNAMFAIFGALMIYGLIRSSTYSHQLSAVGSPSMGWAWVFALGVLGTAGLGIFAGCSEKPLVLKIFAGFMGVGMIVMMIFGIICAAGKQQMKAVFQDDKVAKTLLHDPGMRQMLDHLQAEGQCCGITSASNWGGDIPSSCSCGSGYMMYTSPGCKAKPQTCSKYIFAVLDTVFSIVFGIFFGFAAVALLGLLISLLMLHQIKRHDNAGASFDMKGY
ncbi:Tetraspanin-7 [Nibea albiflora]|uniref:Tetraspanin-7 n=1 Tax=Nibea albiflora TaxID=240163 RepID=A0ACB7ETW2_NIBAL|nr:Tetraspanin-7 [Nibea albiflora]